MDKTKRSGNLSQEKKITTLGTDLAQEFPRLNLVRLHTCDRMLDKKKRVTSINGHDNVSTHNGLTPPPKRY